MLINLIVAFIYLFVAVAYLQYERAMVRRYGADAFTIFSIFLFIYMLAPSIGLHALLVIYGPDISSGKFFFDGVYSRISSIDSVLVLSLVLFFLFGLYFSAKGARGIGNKTIKLELSIRHYAMYGGIIFGLLICMKFFWGLGSGIEDRYAKLILFRNISDLIERDFFTANVFSLTQTFTWASAALFFCYKARGSAYNSLFLFICMIFFAFLMGSRRGFIFPILIIYFSSILMYQKFYIRSMLIILPVVFAWIAYGKELTGSVAYGVSVDDVFSGYSVIADVWMRVLSEVGITQVQSFAVFQNLDGFTYPRLGIDHILSVLRRVPDGLIGLSIDWPERIVRTSTRLFISNDAADVPPGLIGQSWLDLPFIGAFAWGVFLGLQVRILNKWTRIIKPSPEKAALTAIIAMIIALPINTGSFDFTFSVDMIFLVAFMFIFFKVKKYVVV